MVVPQSIHELAVIVFKAVLRFGLRFSRFTCVLLLVDPTGHDLRNLYLRPAPTPIPLPPFLPLFRGKLLNLLVMAALDVLWH